MTSRLLRLMREPERIVPGLRGVVRVYIYYRAIHNWRAFKQWIRESIVEGFNTYTRIWEDFAQYRPLLAIPWHQLSLKDRILRVRLLVYVAIPDLHYRLSLRRLNRLIPRPDQAQRSGTTVMIGSLGAGGAERQLVILMRGLLARKITDAEVVCGALDTPDMAFFLPVLTADGVTVAYLKDYPVETIDPAVRAAIMTLPLVFQRTLPYLASWGVRRPALAHLWLDETNIMGGIAAVLTGVPRIILSQRSLPPVNFKFHKPYMRESYRWLARQPGVIMVNNSQAGATGYERWLGLRPGTIRVIRNGFEFPEPLLQRYRDGRGSYRAKLGIPDDAPLIGCVFRMSEEKRPVLWLEIAARVRRLMPEARFLVIGDGPLRGEVVARAERDDLKGAVYLPGVEKDSLAAMADMDLLLLTSRVEGLPNVLVEAQAVGTPAVSTSVGGALETIKHGVTGWLLADDNPDHIAPKLVELLRDTAWREMARREAPGFVTATFGLDRAIDETIALYHGKTGGRL